MIVNRYSHHRENAGRNFLGALGLSVVAFAVAKLAAPVLGAATVRTLLIALWPLFAIFAGAVLALLYRLFSDTSSVGKFTRSQRYEVEKIVKKKSRKLWLLFIMILLPLGLAIIGQHIPIGQHLAASVALAIAVAALLFFFAYVPATWLDLRAYVAQLDVEKVEDQNSKDALGRLNK
ncbi:hypothetical protein [Stenotrophomonas maltophilia]|uniref:hypothetical protein n=1 Tax=Stenotrophomonas maltophilia TaxID=40324 RepID=UPI00117E67B1|nr:hypothetical protein [Stenotrophomonas maltophilia]